MAHRFKGKRNQPTPAAQVNAPVDFGAARTGILESIRAGKHKFALDQAKDLHKATHTAESEELLIEAYLARIQALLNQNMAVEAKALMELVRERYPAAGARLNGLGPRIAAKTGAIDDLLRFYGDSTLEPEQRTAIDLALRRDVTDLSVIARSEALPAEHPLRTAARALHQAFVAATSGTITDETIALAEVSRRSPLAPWKALVRAITLFYRREDESCRQALTAIDPESAPARLVPAIQAMLGSRPAGQLSPAAATLVSRAMKSTVALRSALERLEAAYLDTGYDSIAALQRATRAVIHECRQAMPERVEHLKNQIVVRSMMLGLEAEDIAPHLGGPIREDVAFFRMLARGMEQVGAPPAIAIACGSWNQFRIEAAKMGWFKPNGPEAAAIYLHMAGILAGLDDDDVWQMQQVAPEDSEGGFLLDPAALFQRGCVLDPHSEAFSQWLNWAKRGKGAKAEQAAQAWHKAVPGDIEPLLYLMERSSARNSFNKALQYLGEAERIDSVNPAVRRARLPLMAQQALNQIKQRKPRQAWQTIRAMEELPQSAQGDRPAFMAALRCVASAGEPGGQSSAHRAEAAKILGSPAAASLLIQLVAEASKQAGFLVLERPGKLERAERAGLPATMARLFGLASSVSLSFRLPFEWLRETEKQFAKSGRDLDQVQLLLLAEAGLQSGYREIAYAASAEGLNRAAAPVFLLTRGRALPEAMDERRAACAAAAAELAREHRDMETVDRAVQLLRQAYDAGDFTLTIDQARMVLAREKKASKFPRYPDDGPTYRDIMPTAQCPCPDCRRARGEDVPEFEDDFDEEDFDDEAADDELPPRVIEALVGQMAREVEKSQRRGETESQFVSRMMEMMGLGGKKGKPK